MANMRKEMPWITDRIDELRAVFGKEGIDDSIRNGMKPTCRPEERFFAQENGHTVGRRYEPDPSKVISAADMQIGPAFQIEKGRSR